MDGSGFRAWGVGHTPTPDPESQEIQDYLDSVGGNELGRRTPGEVRDWFSTHFGRFDMDPKPPVGSSEDITIPVSHSGESLDIGARVYRPSAAGEGPLPAYVHCHAGAMVAGDLDLLDSFCRLMCEHAGCVVVSLDYRRAPEAKYPLPLEDCYGATAWISDNAAALDIDAARIAVGGDSSGGTLATVTCRLARDRAGPAICRQLLWYPGVGSLGPTESEALFGDNYFPQNALVRWSMQHYLPDDADPTDSHIQPIRLEDMSGLPPAFVMTAGYDGRRDPNLQYAERLRDAGVPTDFYCVDSTIHGFLFLLGGLSVGREAALFSARYLRDAFNS
jgi:acetyl esterase